MRETINGWRKKIDLLLALFGAIASVAVEEIVEAIKKKVKEKKDSDDGESEES